VSGASLPSVSLGDVGNLVSSSVGLAFPLEYVPSFPSSTLSLNGTPSHSGNQSSSGTQSSEGSRIRYSLHNRVVLTEDLGGCGVEDPLGQGLGSLPRAPSSSRGRGRRSHLLLAQDRARIDLASGRQSSIEWALREKQPQEVVSL
jgi:hypothetical protein